MKNIGKPAAIAVLFLSLATTTITAAQEGTMVVAPGGDPVYHIVTTGKGDQETQTIIECRNSCSDKTVLLSSSEGRSPESNLTGLSNLTLSPDSAKLYFEAEAWATSNAIHVINIKTKATRFVTAGELACVVGSGQYQGDLIVSKHEYFIQGGSYNPLYLYSPEGKQLGIVALDTDEASKFCGAL